MTLNVIEHKSQIKRITHRVWEVESETMKGKFYTVWLDKRGFHCTCKGFTVHKTECKHIKKVKESLKRK